MKTGSSSFGSCNERGGANDDSGDRRRAVNDLQHSPPTRCAERRIQFDYLAQLPSPDSGRPGVAPRFVVGVTPLEAGVNAWTTHIADGGGFFAYSAEP
jgi:hypothetical protein